MKKYIYTGLLICAFFVSTSLTSVAEGYTTTPSLRKMGYVIAKDTISPNKRYGVCQYDSRDDEKSSFNGNDDDISPKTEKPNYLIDLKTGNMLLLMKDGVRAGSFASVGWREVEGTPDGCRWSSDSRLFLWKPTAKWSEEDAVLLEIENGKISRRIDLRDVLVKEILARVKKAAPKDCKKFTAKANTAIRNAASQKQFPDGFCINTKVVGPLKFPINVIAELDTGRCAPGKLVLNATLTGTIDESGKLTVKNFKMDPVSYEPDSYL